MMRHPFAVGKVLHVEGCSEEVVPEGILHDTLEDTETYYESSEEEFGVRIDFHFYRNIFVLRRQPAVLFTDHL
ncbi:hypothetical protein AB685_20545 [Bacillus sp. LL01]|uniref:hypothetical protein n=1 Tax=Bacillus sp. LL01 TaxID=1665556 RepID=UPI00064D0FD7|nr:hypothetical protein [Bacillus sp. LL01]KMJ56660.1 hypothetical protein AB685_20545 [Bacillus sp. LL01]